MKNSKILGDRLVVILNRDDQRYRPVRMPQLDRKILLESIRYVDEVVIAIDKDKSVSETLEYVKPTIFAKGTYASAKEIDFCTKNNIKIVNNVGALLHLQNILYEVR